MMWNLNLPERPFGHREFSTQHKDAFRTLCQRLQKGPLVFPASPMQVPDTDKPQNEPSIAITQVPSFTKDKACSQQPQAFPQNAHQSAKLPRLTLPSSGEEDTWDVQPLLPLKPVAPETMTKEKKPPAEAVPVPSSSSLKNAVKRATTEPIDGADMDTEEGTQGPSGALDEDLVSICIAAKDKNALLVQKMATSLVVPKLLKGTSKLSSLTQNHLTEFFKATDDLAAVDTIMLPLLLQAKTSEAILDVVSVFCAAVDPSHISHLISGYSSKSPVSETDVQILQLLCENAPPADLNFHTSALSMMSRANQIMPKSPVVGRCLLVAAKVLAPHMEAPSLQELRKVVGAHSSVMKGAVQVHLRKVAQ